MVVEPDLDLEHHYAGSDKFYDIHVCDEDAWTFQFEFEYEEDDEWIEGGSFDIEAMAVAPEGNKVWMFEKKQHWEKKVWGWPRVFESESITEALRSAGKDRFIQIKVREITKIPRPCEVAPEAWEWLAKPENLFFGRSIIESKSLLFVRFIFIGFSCSNLSPGERKKEREKELTLRFVFFFLYDIVLPIHSCRREDCYKCLQIQEDARIWPPRWTCGHVHQWHRLYKVSSDLLDDHGG